MPKILWVLYAAYVRAIRSGNGIANWWRARMAGLTRTPTAFVSHPEPRSIGSFATGQQMLVGNFRFNGGVLEAPDISIWAIPTDNPQILSEMHGFEWIDDLAAAGNKPARTRLQGWLLDWVRHYGTGRGPGWEPDVTGRRLIRWISNGLFILGGLDAKSSRVFFRSLSRQAKYLSKCWMQAPEGLARFEAIAGLVYVGLSLEGKERYLRPSVRQLGRECAKRIGRDGSLRSRNPEELMEVFTLLVWAARTLEETGHTPDPRHLDAVARIAPTLRALRLGDGSLARFHSGGRGAEGKLDLALAESGVRAQTAMGTPMGFARIAAGRTTIVMDCAVPPRGEASKAAHASTLSFELSAGRRPLIVNSGPGHLFGEDWRRAARATACHSTMVLDGASSARIAAPGFVGNTFGERLQRAPSEVKLQVANDVSGQYLLARHDGYAAEYGLTHERRVFLSPDGREFRGEDNAKSVSREQQTRFRRTTGGTEAGHLPFTLHFHLHPDVKASLDMGGQAVSLRLKSDEVWIFRQSGGALALESAVYLDQQHLMPRPTQQIIVTGNVQNYEGKVTWALVRAQDGARNTRDLVVEEPSDFVH